MPHSLSAKKRLRQNEKHRLENRTVRSSVRTAIKSLRKSVEAGEFDQAKSEYGLVQKRLDQAVAKGVFHKNTASRYKARLSAFISRSEAK